MKQWMIYKKVTGHRRLCKKSTFMY